MIPASLDEGHPSPKAQVNNMTILEKRGIFELPRNWGHFPSDDSLMRLSIPDADPL